MRFFLVALGCKVNAYEISSLRESFVLRGYEETKDETNADLIVINTCSVTAVADQKSRQHIRRYRRNNEKAIILVMGCYSQKHAEECLSFGASIVLGTTNRKTALESIDEFLKTKTPFIKVDPNLKGEYEEFGVIPFADTTRAYLKIQDGCNNFCSYCLIPFLRGTSRSRTKEKALEECKRIIEEGYKEIVLTGIHIGGYGRDIYGNEYLFADLVEDILKNSPSLYRLRISSIEESEITPKFLRLLEKYDNIADHMHIPLQSGSSSVLKRMHRKYDTESFLNKIEELRKIRPNMAITTDVIVGFPGESEEEWQETKDFCMKARFSSIHVFPFSAREGTLAFTMPNQIDPKTKDRRVHELLEISKKLHEEYKKKFYGTKMEVLIEGKNKENKMHYGRASNHLYVKTPNANCVEGDVVTVLYNKDSAAD
ncbi:MAG: tRNA (N(6)-L-threonylcarbamoyladenosine(37)-C(2))-methylthiotransferase MtaB [Bacilli bacterium]|nr:tRNA (N(6)-L-threonylcarbamoyladenosine(37)-C(2))-methylthiotransferase MtaB [Bacilli bacterium]